MSRRPTQEMAEQYLNCRTAFRHHLTCGQCQRCNNPDGTPMKQELIPAAVFKAMYGMTKADYRHMEEMKTHLWDDVHRAQCQALSLARTIRWL